MDKSPGNYRVRDSSWWPHPSPAQCPPSWESLSFGPDRTIWDIGPSCVTMAGGPVWLTRILPASQELGPVPPTWAGSWRRLAGEMFSPCGYHELIAVLYTSRAPMGLSFLMWNLPKALGSSSVFFKLCHERTSEVNKKEMCIPGSQGEAGKAFTALGCVLKNKCYNIFPFALVYSDCLLLSNADALGRCTCFLCDFTYSSRESTLLGVWGSGNLGLSPDSCSPSYFGKSAKCLQLLHL